MVATESIKVIKSAIEAGNGAIDLYNKTIDKLIPWNTIQATVEELNRFQVDYSKEAATLVGQIKTKLLSCMDSYYISTQKVYEWCRVTTDLMEAYLKLFENYDEPKSSAQKNILIIVLEKGITQIGSAQEALQKSSESLNGISGDLLTLDSQLKSDFDDKSAYFTNQVDKLRKEAYGGAASGVLLGPFGLVISYSVAAGVLEGKLIPELKAKLKSVQEFYENLTKTLSEAAKDLNDGKDKLKNEISNLGKLKVVTETTRFYVDYDDLIIDMLKDSAQKLIDNCHLYQKNHGKKS